MRILVALESPCFACFGRSKPLWSLSLSKTRVNLIIILLWGAAAGLKEPAQTQYIDDFSAKAPALSRSRVVRGRKKQHKRILAQALWTPPNISQWKRLIFLGPPKGGNAFRHPPFFVLSLLVWVLAILPILNPESEAPDSLLHWTALGSHFRSLSARQAPLLNNGLPVLPWRGGGSKCKVKGWEAQQR